MRFSLAQLSNNKPLMLGVAGVAAAALVGTTLGYQALTSEVTLTVDGKSRQVSVLGADTVGDVLKAEGLSVGTRDQVVPSAGNKVTDGVHIAVNYARPVELTVDGAVDTHWVTATDVDGALTEIGRRFDGSDLSVSRSKSIGRDGIVVDVVTPKQVTVKVGTKKPATSEQTASTVAEVLTALGIELDADDEVTPTADTPVAEGTDITVTRVKTVTRTVRGEKIAHGTEERKDDELPKGEEKTLVEGRDGARDVTYSLTLRNGKEVSRTVVSKTVTAKPVKAVVKVGTAEAPSANYAGGNTVWDALARCESGGNWATNTGNGYYGGLQFSAGTWRSVGGAGLPHQASREEQIKRGKILQARSGWGQWPGCASRLGLL